MLAAGTRARGAALGDYVQMVWRRRWIVLLAVMIATAIAITTRPPDPIPLYTATQTVKVQSFTFSGSGSSAIVPIEGVPSAEIEGARSVEAAAETAGEFGMSDGGAALLAGLSVSAQENSDLMQISLTDEGIRTVDMLRTYVKNYVDIRNEQVSARVEEALEQVRERIRAISVRLESISEQLESEQTDEQEASPDTRTRYDTVSALYTNLVNRRELLKLDSALLGDQLQLIGSPIPQKLGALPAGTLRLIAGPIVGFLLGAALAVALGMLRPRVRGREATEDALGVPVLAQVPKVARSKLKRDPLALQRSSGWGSEAMRMLRTEIALIEDRRRRMTIIAVVSPEPRDGKSTIAVNLAAALAAADQRVVLVHSDMRAVERSGYGSGLADFLAEERSEVPVVRNPEGYDEVMPGSREAAARASAPERLSAALKELKDRYDKVIVDTPPLLAFADALLTATEADGVVMVARDGKTMGGKAVEALEVLERHSATVLGVVLNAATQSRLETRRYRHYYGTWKESPSPPAAETSHVKVRPRSPEPPQAPEQVEGVRPIRDVSGGSNG